MPERNFSFENDATAEEAAAVIAAIERFLADHAAAPAESHEVVSGWLRAALAEGVGGNDKESLW